MWEDNNSIFDNAAIDFALGVKKIDVKCCKSPEVHFYAHRFSEDKGTVWFWCSNCKKYQHYSKVKIENNWNNLESVDGEILSVLPDYLEEHKKEIDSFVSQKGYMFVGHRREKTTY